MPGGVSEALLPPETVSGQVSRSNVGRSRVSGSLLHLAVRPSSIFLQNWSPGMRSGSWRLHVAAVGRGRRRRVGDWDLREGVLQGMFLESCGGIGRGRNRRKPVVMAQAGAGRKAGGAGVSRPGEDFVAQVLKSKPSQVEEMYLIGDRYYTLKEKQQLQASWLQKLWASVQLLSSGLSESLSGGAKEGQDVKEVEGVEGVEAKQERRVEQGKAGEEAGTSPRVGDAARTVRPIYISDLLREYKGNLYVPEEAFEGAASELVEFNKDLAELPEMSFEQFMKAAKADQIRLLTSRGVVTPRGKYTYWDFVVELNRIPGEQGLQRRKWAMHLSDEDAKVLLSEYTGPQREVETPVTPYIAVPTVAPHPIAASISGRLVMELTVVTSIISAAALTLGGMASVAVFTLTSALSVVLVHVAWPIAAPLLRPFFNLAMGVGAGIWKIIATLAMGDGVGSKSIPDLFTDAYRYVTSGAMYTSARQMGAIVFVLVTMAAMAKFILTRRPKDFTKWDLWQAIEFGYSKPQARVEGTTGIKFEDVAGIDDVVEELKELVSYLKDPERFNRMGTKPPHGVLLEGPPGCGKTLLAKAIAGEAGVPFYQMAGSEFVEVLVGVGAARIRDLFKRAKVNRPSVVFIDEIDALGAMRHGAAGEEGSDSYNAGAQERETTLNQLLIELDGFDTGKGVVFLGATNRMDMLDPALLRPGRFDRKIAIRPPRAKGRLEILKVHAKSVKLSPSVDLWVYAKNLPGWTGAELAQLLQEAALVTVRHGGNIIMRADMDQALDRLTMGAERLGLERRQPVHRRMATHDVGMAMAAHILRRVENAETEFCDRVSIVPRGETLSRAIFERLDDEAYLFNRRPSLIHRLKVLLAGRAAEELIYGRDTSTFSEQHLADASWLARKIVSVWNLDGPITSHGDKNPWERVHGFTGPPLGFEGGLYDSYELVDKPLNYDLCDDVTARTKRLIDRSYNEVFSLLQQHKAAVAKAVYVVMDREELLGEELDYILDQYPAGTPPQVVENEEDPGELHMPISPEELLSEETQVKSLEATEVTSFEPSEVTRSYEPVEVEPSNSTSSLEDRVNPSRSSPNGNGESRVDGGVATVSGTGEGHIHRDEETSRTGTDTTNGRGETSHLFRAEDLARIDSDFTTTSRNADGEASSDDSTSTEHEHTVASARTGKSDGD